MPSESIELSVVMPVYNEARGVESVVVAWTSMLERLGLTYELCLYNDGSTDDTGHVLDQVAARCPRVHVTHHANRGHGPTILRGYREAVGAWVLQVDSDDEIPAEMFDTLWQRRHGTQAVFGVRHERDSPLVRRVVTASAAFVVRAAFGRGPSDVNVPFRLIRRDALTRLVRGLPDDLFAPNVAISGLVARGGVPFVETPVMTQGRRTGTSTLVGVGKVLTIALRVLRQTLAVAVRRDWP